MAAKTKNRGGGFLCFTPPAVSDDDEEFEPKLDAVNGGGRKRQCKSKLNLFKSRRSLECASCKSDDQEQGKGCNSSELEAAIERLLPESSEKLAEDDRRISTSTSNSCSSSSSTSSTLLTSTLCSSTKQPRSTNRLTEPVKPPAPTTSQQAQTSVSLKALLLLVVSLSLIVFCGRVYAILWTSSFLYFVRRRNSEDGRTNSTVPSPEVLSVPAVLRRPSEAEMKKRVVMEGLLQRNQQYVLITK